MGQTRAIERRDQHICALGDWHRAKARLCAATRALGTAQAWRGARGMFSAVAGGRLSHIVIFNVGRWRACYRRRSRT